MLKKLLISIALLFASVTVATTALAAVDVNQASEAELNSIHGIGPETADAILLYAGNLPTFVVDTYTHRVLARHGWIDYNTDYHELKDHFESSLPADAALYNEYHALLVRVGKDYCRKTAPRCEECPLREMLPTSGIVVPFES